MEHHVTPCFTHLIKYASHFNDCVVFLIQQQGSASQYFSGTYCIMVVKAD